MKTSPAKKPTRKKPVKRERPVITVYLSEETIKILDDKATETGQSRSQVVKGLITGSDAANITKITGLVGEIADLLAAR